MIALKQKSLLIVIPAFNEEDTIGSIVSELLGLGDVLVIDDGSTDHTREIALAAGARVEVQPNNYGYESAIERGLHYGLTEEYDKLVTVDADGEHKTADVARVAFSLERVNLVLTNRSSFNRYSEHLASFLARIRYGIKDPLSGLKGYDITFMKDKLKKVSISKSAATLDLIRKLLFSGASVEQLDIVVAKRQDSSRYGSSILGELRTLRAVFVGRLL